MVPCSGGDTSAGHHFHHHFFHRNTHLLTQKIRVGRLSKNWLFSKASYYLNTKNIPEIGIRITTKSFIPFNDVPNGQNDVLN